MKRTRKILALLLCIVMCLSLFPVSAVAAEEEPAEVVTDEATVPEVTDDAQGEEAGEPADPADPAAPVDGEGTGEENGTDTDPVDPADPAAGTELNGGENTDPADPADGTDPADEPTDGEDAEEAEETEEKEEEEEQAELPYGFVGMPEGYEFSKAELAAKRALTEMGTVDLLAGLVPDVNYREGQILVSADSREYAELVAAAFDAEILRFNGFTAKLQLNSATTLQAVEAAASMELPLPAAEPNYINDMGILPGGNPPATEVTDQALQATTWMDWMEAAEITDPFVTNPDYWNGYQWMHDMVKTYGAWSVTTGSSAVTVAVIDTGVDYEHEDLPNVTTGGDYVSEDDDPWDENNHGTHVSGIIAAAWNGIGGIGIAPGVEIYAVRVVDASGSYETDDLIDGIDDAISHGVDIINLSLGSTYDEIVLRRAIERAVDANITVVVAMGNEASNVKKFPAAYEDVVAVAAVDITGNRANYSNYGAWCDVSAPGSGIMSTIPGDSYDWMDGTSMATPVVSGLAALYMSAYGNPGPAAMQSILRAAVNKGGGAGMGTGIVDATKLFANENDRKAPIVTAMKKAPYSDDEGAVSPVKGVYELSTQDRLLITSGNTAREKEECMFVFADNGKKPAIVNGAPANGTKVSGGSIELSEYPIGKTITFNIAEANEVGFCSNVTTVKVKIVPSVNREILDNIEVSIQAPTKVVAGKSVTLSALVSSTYDDGDRKRLRCRIR